MDPFQQRLARVALAAATDHGYALGGSNALLAHGLLDRPTDDVDLFCTGADTATVAAEAIAAAYRHDGLHVVVDRVAADFARLLVSHEHGGSSRVELVRDYRVHPPVRLDVGPVLHRDDAVGNKVAALFSRAEARDFIDVAAALSEYSRDQLLTLAAERDPGFDRGLFAAALSRLERLPDARLTAYGLNNGQVRDLRETVTRWRAELTAPPSDSD